MGAVSNTPLAHEVPKEAKDQIVGDIINAMAEKRSELAIMTQDSSQGEWTDVKGKKNNICKNGSPKSNTFMVYSDFTYESRFPIN